MLSRSRSSRFALTLGLLFVLTGAKAAHASFSLTFRGLVQTLNTGGSISLSSPAGVVVDTAGDTFIVDTGNNRIVEVTAQGVASVLTVSGLSPSLSSPGGIAIDGSGNLYVVDTGNGRLVKISSSGAGSVVGTGSVTLSSPRGIAIDQSGDLFVADTGNNRIVEITSGGSAAALSITVSSGASTLSSPKGLAVGVSGTLFIADSGNNRIVKLASASTTGVVQSILGGVTLSNPSAVTADRIGNLIIADTGNDRIAEVDTSNYGTVLYTSSVTLNGPLGVAVDAFGAVTIADTGDSRGVVADPLVNADVVAGDQTYSLNQSTVGFGHISLGSSNAVTLTLPFTTGSVGLGGVKVFTTGTQNLDFVAGPDTTCNSSTTASTSCSVEVSFLPTAPGMRRGAVVLYDTSLNPILTIPLYGFGDAPVAALSPNIGTVIGTGSQATSNPYQIALDGAGNLYVGDYTGKNVAKVPAGGGSASLISLGTPGSPAEATQDITGVALDGAGNLFIGDHQNSRILVVTPAGVVSVLSISGLSPSLGFPTALCFDAAGNLYIADFTGGRIVEVSSIVVAGSTSSGLGTVIGSGSYSFTGSTLTGLTIDSQANIYVAARTQNSSSIIKITRAGVASALALSNGIVLNDPQGVAADAMGNIYIVDTANNRIVEVDANGATTALTVTGLSSPSTLGSLIFGVTVDPTGNLYIPDWTNNRLVFVNVSGSALNFATTAIGSTSSDSPRIATVTNLGDQQLVFSTNPSFTSNFVENGSDPTPCTSNTSLSIGVSCDVAVKFTPQSVGNLSAGITVTNNSLNVAGSTQQVSVTGTGFSAGDTTSTAITITPSAAVYGQAVAIVAKVTDTQSGRTTTVPTGSVVFTDIVGSTVSPLGSATLSTSSSAALPSTLLSGLGTHTLTASYQGVSSSFLVSNGSGSIVLSQATVTLAGPTTQPVSIVVGQTGSIPVTITGAYTTATAPSGTISYSILNSSNSSVLSGTASLTAGSGSSSAAVTIPNTLAAGSYTVSISYVGDPNYQSSAAPIMVTLHIGQITPTVSWTPAGTISYGTTLAALLTATAANGGTTIPGSFRYTIAASGGVASPVTAATVLGAGTYVLTATFTPTDTTTYATSSTTATLIVGKVSDATALTSSTNPSLVTNATTLVATVTTSVATPTGSVGFYDGTTLLGTETLTQGQAAYTTAGLATGSHSITAVYSGDGNFLSSTSSTVVQLVQDFTLSTTSTSGTTTAPTATVAPGGTATYTLSIGPSVGTVLPAPVTLSVTGLPTGATATLSPDSLPAGAALTSVTLTIQLPQQTANLHRDRWLAAPTLALLLLPFAGRMRRTSKTLRHLGVFLLLIVGASAVAGLAGCGAKDSGLFGEAQKTYTVLVVATSGSVSHSTPVTLTVQ